MKTRMIESGWTDPVIPMKLYRRQGKKRNQNFILNIYLPCSLLVQQFSLFRFIFIHRHTDTHTYTYISFWGRLAEGRNLMVDKLVGCVFNCEGK